MFCQRCLIRLSGTSVRSHASRAANSSTSTITSTSTSNLQLSSPRAFIRPFTQSSTYSATPVTAQTATSTNSRPNDAVSAATSTSAAQPFSTPTTPSPSSIADIPIKPDQTKQPAARAPSSVPAGTVLKGLNFLKTASDPVAKADEEYPPWLWTVLDSGASGREAQGENSSEGDLFSKSKKLRRRAAKALRRAALQNPEALAPKIPLQQQSIDLPAGDGTLAGALHAGDARARLTKAMRDQRRKKIKEDNFLREMR